jgi:hypothetical protein
MNYIINTVVYLVKTAVAVLILFGVSLLVIPAVGIAIGVTKKLFA